MKIIGNPRVFCDGMKGENYFLFGCLAYLSECLGLGKDYDYTFFTNMSGDGVRQVHSADIAFKAWYPSYAYPLQGLDRAFAAIGYTYDYITGVNNENRNNYLPRIRDSIDNGLPVIFRRLTDCDEFCTIVGYDDDGFLCLRGDQAAPISLDMDFTDLIFCGRDTGIRRTMADMYRAAVMETPELLRYGGNAEFSLGIKAIYDWAELLESGRLCEIDDAAFDVWNVHGIYLCMLGTNGRGFGLFGRAAKYNPDMSVISGILPIYDEISEVFHALLKEAGGFSLTPADAKSPTKLKGVCAYIRRAAAAYERMLGVFDGYHS